MSAYGRRRAACASAPLAASALLAMGCAFAVHAQSSSPPAAQPQAPAEDTEIDFDSFLMPTVSPTQDAAVQAPEAPRAAEPSPGREEGQGSVVMDDPPAVSSVTGNDVPESIDPGISDGVARDATGLAAGSPDGDGSDVDTLDMDALEIDMRYVPEEADVAPPPPDGSGAVAPVDPDIAFGEGEGEGEGGRYRTWLDAFRVSLQHEVSYKFASPKRLVNNRSSVRVEFSHALTRNLFFRLDTKYNLHWARDHRARAKDENPFRELVTREAYVQTSFGETSLRIGHQILPWGVSEGGAITDEVSPRNSAEFFFVPLEESRIGQPMITLDRFSGVGQWTAFFVPRPAYNRYPDIGSEYDIPGAFVVDEPDSAWTDTGDYEYGLRWKRSFGKSDFSLMAASLIDNDYLIRKQRMQMVGMTANIAVDNLLYRAEVAVKHPRVFLAADPSGGDPQVVKSDVLDASFGFDYSPGGRVLTYSAELVLSRLLDRREGILGRERDDYSLVAGVSNSFLHEDLTVSWLTIYGAPYTRLQHRFLGAYAIDDNSTIYLEFFYPDERDARSGTWSYRDQKQIAFRYQYQF